MTNRFGTPYSLGSLYYAKFVFYSPTYARPCAKKAHGSCTIVAVTDNGRSNQSMGILRWKMITLEDLIFQLVISD